MKLFSYPSILAGGVAVFLFAASVSSSEFPLSFSILGVLIALDAWVVGVIAATVIENKTKVLKKHDPFLATALAGVFGLASFMLVIMALSTLRIQFDLYPDFSNGDVPLAVWPAVLLLWVVPVVLSVRLEGQWRDRPLRSVSVFP